LNLSDATPAPTKADNFRLQQAASSRFPLFLIPTSNLGTMADVDMTDVPTASGSGSAPTKKVVSKGKASAADGADGKKRFEVKKV
jgi:hypothetical protein